jgi:RsiW-degrading membrane proteinase PrsW (M82 family)
VKPILQLWNIAAAVILFVFLRRRLAHMNDKRLPNVLGAFLVAGVLSMGLTWAFYELYPPGLAISLSRWDLAYHIGVVGLVEESAKFLAFLFVVKAGETIREPQDGIIHAAAVGITFGAIENIAYIMYFDHFFIALRPILTTAGHGIYAAIWGGYYAQAVYANTIGRDPGATRNALIGVPLVAVIHGIYNAATFFYPVALLVDLLTLLGAIVLYYRLVELSPYRVYPLRQARAAVESIRRGLVFNPKSALLNRNLGLYLMHLGRYRGAAQHLRASVPRSRDPRRAQFLAAACELTFLPRYYAKRAMRTAWARLTDEQRESYLAQLDRLVGDRDGVRDGVRAFLQSAFKPRTYRKTRDIAREMKVRRIERRRPAPAETTRRALESLDDDERARLRRQWSGGV